MEWLLKYHLSGNVCRNGFPDSLKREISQLFHLFLFRNVWFQKISIPPPRRELEIPEGWGGGGSMAQEIPEGRRGEWLDKFPEGQLQFMSDIVVQNCNLPT